MTRDEQLDAAVTAYLKAVESGELPDAAEWLARYPDLADELRQFLADQRSLDRIAAPLRDLAHATPTHPEVASESATAPVRCFGDYEALEEIARGGMGVVFKARQVSLNRPVALKMILAGQLASEAEVQRFRQEAEAAANLDHPNILPIYEVGEHDGRPYFAMKLIAGGNLAQHLGKFRDDPRAAAALVEQLARAVHHAHQRGILHRDLKPANVLLEWRDDQAEPFLADFGLARRLEGAGVMTQSGVLIGTPEYMAPEQVRGHKGLTTAADVYALGGILYALLTGRSPFQGDNVMQTLRDVLDTPPASPRSLNPAVPRDLAVVCLKCLEKEPQRRYSSAESLAEDLRRWQAGEPIEARPVGAMGRARLWARRNPAVASLLAVVLLVSVTGTVASTWFAVDARQKQELADERADATDEALNQKGIALNQKQEALEKAREAATRESAARTKAEQQRRQADLALQVNRLVLARKEGEAGNAPGALSVLEECRWDLRGWEWSQLRRRWASQVEPLWTAAGAQAVCYSPDSSRIATIAGDGRISLRDARTGRELFFFSAHDQAVPCLAFSPDGRWLASAALVQKGPALSRYEIRVWEADRGRLVREFRGHTSEVLALCFSPDGRRLASTSGWHGSRGELGLWDLDTGEGRVRVAVATPGGLTSLAFSPDSRRLAGATSKGIKVLNPDTGESVSDLGTDFAVRGVCFSPDGRWLAACGSRRGAERDFQLTGLLRVWDARTNELRRDESGPEVMSALCFSPDGRHLATAVEGAREIRLTDAQSGKTVLTFRGYGPLTITGLCFRPDGQHLASWEGRLSVWDARGDRSRSIPTGHVSALRFASDSSRLLGTGADGRLRCWDPCSGREVPAPPEQSPGVPGGGVLSPDGRTLVTIHRTGNQQGQLKLLAAPSGQLLRVLTARRGFFGNVCFSPDSRSLAAVSTARDREDPRTIVSSEVQVWNVEDGKERVCLPFGRMRVTRVCFSPDSKLLATASGPGPLLPAVVKLWDARTGEERWAFKGHSADVADACFSPDGRRLATAGTVWDAQRRAFAGGEVKLWDVVGGQETLSLRGYRQGVHSICFSPDGRWLASAALDDTIRIWDGADAWQACPLRRLSDEIKRVGFSSDGRRLIAQVQPDRSGTGIGPADPIPAEVHGWDTTTGEEVVPCTDPAPATREAESPDGELVALNDGRELRVRRRAHLTPAARARRDEEDFWIGIGWHEQQASEAAAAGHWFAATFHRDCLRRTLPPDLDDLRRLALCQAAAGQDAAHRRTCAELLVALHPYADVLAALRPLAAVPGGINGVGSSLVLPPPAPVGERSALVRACLLCPDTVPDPARLLPVLPPADPVARGAALFRAGKHAEAAQLLSGLVEPAGQFYLALAEQGRGRTAEARQALKRARGLVATRAIPWEQLAEIERLRTEVEAALHPDGP